MGDPRTDENGDRDGADREHHAPPPRRPRSTGSVALGRVMMGLGEIIEGKPARDAYEHVLEIDESGEPVDPRSLVIDLTPQDPSS